MRVSVAAGALSLVLALLAGCGGPEATGDSRLTIYLSAPLTGPARSEGKSVVAGAREALEAAGAEAAGVTVDLEILDGARDGAPWDPVTVAANARRATRDSTSSAYLGELESGATRTSLPITNDAELLQIAPGSPAADLVGPFEGSDEVPEETQPTGIRTFGRVVDGDDGEELGYRAAAVALDAVERAEDPLSRGSVIEAFFATGEHDSVAGTYSVDELGEIEFPQG